VGFLDKGFVIEEASVRRLHDKHTRGIVLDVHEQSLLEAWLREQDEAETALLRASDSSQDAPALRLIREPWT